MGRGAAASTTIEGGQAASQALLVDGGEAGRAIDAVVAGVLAIAARRPGVLLGAGVILLGGTGEGSRVVDGRARQPGLGAPRPRGYPTLAEVPDAARVAVPGLPAALMVAHAGRGVRSASQLAKLATTTAESLGKIDPARVKSIHAFGRAGPMFLRAGAVRDALLAAGARSLGGTLTTEDLDAATATTGPAFLSDHDARRWIITPFRDPLATIRKAPEGEEPPAPETSDGAVEIVAAADAHGAIAIACVAIPSLTTPLEETGLAAPLLAEPILRGVTRLAPASILPLPVPIGIAQPRDGGADLALGLAARLGSEALFARLVTKASAPLAMLDELLAAPRARPGESEEQLGVGCGVARDSRGDARALVDPRRR
jgi:gamma-glutamyltranspeptidase/glutathione hydrolase